MPEYNAIKAQNQRVVLSWVGAGLSMEEAMRLLFPKEAEVAYDLSRGWYGPTPGSNERY